ncbi:Ig-like domain-containing protein [Luteimicrobium sp. DT211]|uniref:Ig-like domain-containing protein n=1 Tax=Luteimicrobium sp. DT211 TaxID=3393412 RepID=UPI003CEA3C98
MSTVSVVATAMIALALTYDGQATAHVDLNDSGVWVTRGTGAELGRFNTAAQALDATLVSSGTSVDVLQQAETVLAYDPSLGTLSPVDVAGAKLKGTAKLPGDAQVGLGGPAVAVLDGDKGTVWVLPASGVASFDPETTPAATTVKKGAVLAVGTDGTVHVADPSGQLTTITTTDQGTAQKVGRRHLKGVGANDALSVTAVGSTPVVLDATTQKLYLSDGAVSVSGADAVLQQPSGDSSTVAYATTTGLVSQPLDGSAAVTHETSGRPTAPVQVGGCTYGAWSTTGQVVRDCAGTMRDLDQHIESGEATLRYRVNRSNVVLNDLAAGTVWLAADEFQKVDDWEQKVPEDAKGDPSDAADDTPEQVDKPITHRTEKNHPPVAKDDTFGVRPDRSTVLPVLMNDTDPDGDVLAAEVAGDGPPNAVVSQVLGGDALLATTDETSKGASTFRYRVTDGRGGEDTATVQLKVVPYDVNHKPDQTGEPVLTIVRGGTATIKVLPFFSDPDGDDLFLGGAEAKVKGDEVRYQTDGTVEYRDSGSSTGRKAVELLVSDGMGGTAHGTLWVDVKGSGNQPPVAVGDHATTRPGEPVTIYPLRNDTDANGDALRLASVSQPSGAKVSPSYGTASFQLVADKPGSYVGTYQLSDGPSATTGVYRVDVVAPKTKAGPPVAVPDTALLPSGGQTLVDVLANDSDPTGGVLVVQSVDVPADAPVTVAVLGHSVLRIAEARHLNEPVTIHYTVSNGTDTATGQVRVIPIPAPNKLHPPHAVADEATVHVGDVVTIPVLTNDTHPDGLALLLQKKLAREPSASLGRAFVSDDVVRFQATGKPGTAYLIYRVRDKNGQEDSAQVTIHVLGDTQNSPPAPPTITARATSGGTVTIAPKLDGVDPDGDSVRLTGLVSAPSLGTAEVTAGTIVYTAGEGSVGTDSFQYRVIDRRGLDAVGTIRVGIAPRTTVNQPPVAVNDTVTVRPGRTVSVAPLKNDSDPDGDAISLTGDLRLSPGISAKREGNLVAFTAPEQKGTWAVYYTVADTRGGRATGTIVVTVDGQAPLQPPVAQDDIVSDTDVADKKVVLVGVLANDSDPDGSPSALKVTAQQPGVTVRPDGSISVPLTSKAQVFPYTVTDPDGLTDQAFVWVPALPGAVAKPDDPDEKDPTATTPPRPAVQPLTVKSGEPLTIDVRKQVKVGKGLTARLTTESNVKAVNGSRDVLDTHTIRFVSDDRFAGNASVSFEITDGKTADDPKGRTLVVTVPIKVTPPENVPPVLSGSPTVRVGTGDADGQEADLSGIASDLDDDPLTYRLGAVPRGLKATIDGSVVHVVADSDTPKGTTLAVPFTVGDGHAGHDVEGKVTVSVVASNRALPVAVEDVVEKAPQGKLLTIPVLDNDTNPFAVEGKPLTLVSVTMDTQSDASTPVVKDNQVQITPGADFHGQIALRYTVQDATKDPDRQVEGHVLVTVQGRPDAPVKPEIGTIESHQVTLSWTPPNNNGAEIDHYTVTPSGAPPQECLTTTCTITGLTNDQEYTFTVTAHNEVADSEPSPESDPARPDQRPDQPSAPTLEFGDGELTVSWANQTYSDRSAIQSVNLLISPAPASGVVEIDGVTGTTTVWKGLANGTAYTVQVQAVNKADKPSDWSAASASEFPAGKPDAPAKPDVTRTSIGTTSQMKVTWGTPNDNGADISGYDIAVVQGSTTSKTVTAAGSATSATIEVGASTTGYTFMVRAKNKATDKFGDAPWSPASSPVRAFAKPGAPSSIKVAATGVDKQVTATWGKATGAGLTASEIHYEVRCGSGSWSDRGASVTSYTFACGSNGTASTVYVRAVPAVDGVDESNASSTVSGSAAPYGPVGSPSISWNGWSGSGGSYTGSFDVSYTNNSGQSATVTVTGSASGSFTVAVGGTKKITVTTGTVGYSKSVSITATTKGAKDGKTSSAGKASSSDSPAAPPPPVQKLWIQKGGTLNYSPPQGNCTSSSCKRLVLYTENFSGAGTIYVACGDSGGTWSFGHTYNVPVTGSVPLLCTEADWDSNTRALVGTNSSGGGGTPAYWNGS